MAERYGRERGFGERAADEMRSWIGDEDAERRREMDAARERERERERSWSERPQERSWSREYRDYPQDRPMTREDYRDREYRYSGQSERDRTDWGWGRNRGYEESQRSTYMDPAWRRSESYSTPTYLGRTDFGRSDYSRSDFRTGGYTGMSYSGMGPRGYRRSDQRVLEDVCDRLTEDPRVNASDIEVKVNEAQVSLSGTVQSREEKRVAEDIAEAVTGVRDVSNNLRVSSGIIGSTGAPQTPLNLSSPGGESRQVVNTEAESPKRR